MIGWVATIARELLRGAVRGIAGALERPSRAPEPAQQGNRGWTYRDVQGVQEQIRSATSHGTVSGKANESAEKKSATE